MYLLIYNLGGSGIHIVQCLQFLLLFMRKKFPLMFIASLKYSIASPHLTQPEVLTSKIVNQKSFQLSIIMISNTQVSTNCRFAHKYNKTEVVLIKEPLQVIYKRRREAFTKKHYCRLIMHVLYVLLLLWLLPIKAKKMIRFLYGISNYFLAIEVDPSSSSSLSLWKYYVLLEEGTIMPERTYYSSDRVEQFLPKAN